MIKKETLLYIASLDVMLGVDTETRRRPSDLTVLARQRHQQEGEEEAGIAVFR